MARTAEGAWVKTASGSSLSDAAPACLCGIRRRVPRQNRPAAGPASRNPEIGLREFQRRPNPFTGQVRTAIPSSGLVLPEVRKRECKELLQDKHDGFAFAAAYSGSPFSKYMMLMNWLGLPNLPNQRS